MPSSPCPDPGEARELVLVLGVDAVGGDRFHGDGGQTGEGGAGRDAEAGVTRA
jgi:hypothetical protein